MIQNLEIRERNNKIIYITYRSAQNTTVLSKYLMVHAVYTQIKLTWVSKIKSQTCQSIVISYTTSDGYLQNNCKESVKNIDKSTCQNWNSGTGSQPGSSLI